MINKSTESLVMLLFLLCLTITHFLIVINLIIVLGTNDDMDEITKLFIWYTLLLLLVGVFPTPIYFLKKWTYYFLYLPNLPNQRLAFIILYGIEILLYTRIAIIIINLPKFKELNKKTVFGVLDGWVMVLTYAILYNHVLLKYLVFYKF